MISPLLANSSLHVLERVWTARAASVGRLIRYADDFVIICQRRQEAEKALQVIQQTLGKLKLTLHPTKTRLVDMGQEGCEVLGFHIHKMRTKRAGKLAPFMWPGQKAMKAVRSQSRQLTDRRGLRIPLRDVVAQLNPVIRGWRNYFHIGNSTKKFQDMDRYVRLRLWKSARARQGLRGCLALDQFKRWIAHSGVAYFYQPGICGARP